MPSPNVVQFSSATPTVSCLNNNNFYLGVQNQGYGRTSDTGFWNGITPPSGGYTTYSNKNTQGPSIRVFDNDADLVSFMFGKFPNDFGSIYQLPEFARIPVIFSIANTYNDFIILEKDYENIITDDLVLCLDAGFKNSYGGLGTSWRDLSVENNNGTLTNGPTYSTDGEGSIVFDGTDDYVIASQIFSGFMDDTNLTYCAWCYPTSTNTNFGAIVNQGRYNYEPAWRGNKFDLWYWDTSIISVTNLSINKWYYVSVIKSGTSHTMIIYYDNIIYSNTIVSSKPGISWGDRGSDVNIYLGTNGAGEDFGGKISNVSIYNRALTADEITQNYNAQKGRFGITDNTEPPTGGAPPPAVSPTPTPTITPTITLTPSITPTLTPTPSSTPAPEIISDGLVFAVDAGNTNSYSGSGTTWKDLSGNGNDVTLINNPTYSPDFGGIINFDGANDNANFTITDGSQFRFMSLWFKLNGEVSPTVSNMYILLTKDGGLQSTIGLGDWTISRTNETLVLFGNDEIYYYDYTFLPNVWYNLSINWNGTTYDTYLNNTLLTNLENLNSGVFGGNNTYTIGRNPDSDSYPRFLNGSLSNYFFYNRSFTREEITQNYNALKGRFGL